MAKKPKAAKRAKPARKPARSVRETLSVATNNKKSPKERIAALAEAPLAVCEKDENLQAILKILRDKEEPTDVRLAALRSLQAASFSVVEFEPCRGDYIATLRAVAEDPNPVLRERVLSILARKKDGFAQKNLLEGLQNPEKALVSPEKALQLLSYDKHAEAYPVARAVVSNPPNATAKREALRLLAADASAAPLFEKILRDKGETPEIRQTAAAALQAIRPEKLLAHAREMLLDTSEKDEMHALSLTALTHFGGDTVAKDKELLKRVGMMLVKKGLKEIAHRFLNKQELVRG